MSAGTGLDVVLCWSDVFVCPSLASSLTLVFLFSFGEAVIRSGLSSMDVSLLIARAVALYEVALVPVSLVEHSSLKSHRHRCITLS